MPVDISVTLKHASIPGNIVKTDTATFKVQDFSWGADNPITIGSASAGAGAGKAKFAEASFTKLADNVASPLLFQLLVTGEHLETVTIELTKAGAAGPGTPNAEILTTITLSMVFVTHFGQSVAGGDEGLQEVVNLAYGAAQMTVNGADATGKSITGTPSTWNQVTNNSTLGAPGEALT